MRWRPGEAIVRREVLHGRVWLATMIRLRTVGTHGTDAEAGKATAC